MIPYEEPYQTMFQKRRLGALGKEWRPSSLKLAVGPDITLDRDYQMAPLADLDLAEPLPEFIDVMEWEPEVDILSDENDSEYNVPEEYSSGKEQECLNSPTSSQSGSSSGESDEDDDHQNSLRRSKRKKHKKEAGIMTSSGRRIKRRNFDELEGARSNKKRTRKSRSGRKESKKKSSKSNSARPRRAAARNALSWFSKITGTSKDAEDEVSELSDSSESESTTQDSGTGDSELDVALLNGHGKQIKGKNILVCDSDDGAQQCDIKEIHPAERRLVLRFPVRNSDKLTLLENLPGSSSDVTTPNLGNCCAEDSRIPGNLEINTNQFEGLYVSKVKWGMVKARTSKRIRGEAISSHELMGSYPEGKENNVNEDANHHGNGVTAPTCLELKTDIDGMTVDNVTGIYVGLPNGGKRYPELDGSPSQQADGRASNSSQDITGHRHDLIDRLPPILRRLRIRSKRVSRAPDVSLRQDGKSSSIDQETGGSDALNDGFDYARCELALDCQNDGVAGTEISLRNDCVGELNPQTSDALSIANDVPVSHSYPKKMFEFVYRRLKPRNHKNKSDRDAILTKEISPGSCSQDQGSGSKSHEGASNGFHGTQLNGFEKSECSLTCIQDKISDSRGNPNSQEELTSASGATLRLRSTRNRKSTYPFSETKPIETKKPQQSIENVSWLTLSIHEEGSRYIPQMGDEVANLRQGHQEYLNFSSLRALRDVAPWTSIKGGNIKAVEICKVESLEYATLPGSGDSCCKLILKVIDPNSDVFNKTFKLTLPEVVTFPDFLVERSRYEAAIQRNWTCRDKCKVWWRDGGEEDGSWWEGRILAVKPKSPDFPDSPWERYTVKYKSDPTETHLHRVPGSFLMVIPSGSSRTLMMSYETVCFRL